MVEQFYLPKIQVDAPQARVEWPMKEVFLITGPSEEKKLRQQKLVPKRKSKRQRKVTNYFVSTQNGTAPLKSHKKP